MEKMSGKLEKQTTATIKKLILQGNSGGIVVAAVSKITGVSKEQLKAWMTASGDYPENFFSEKKSTPNPPNTINSQEKDDRLAPYRDKSVERYGPEEAELKKIEEEILSDTFSI